MSKVGMARRAKFWLFRVAYLFFTRMNSESKCKKVLVTGDWSLTGGTGAFLIQVVEYLHSRGWTVVIHVPQGQPDPTARVPKPTKIIPGRRRSVWGRMLELRGVLRRERPGLVVVTSGGFDLFNILSAYPIPAVNFVHSVLTGHQGHREGWVLGRFGKSIDRIVAVSDYAREALATYLGDPGRAKVLRVYNGVPDRGLATPGVEKTVCTIGHVVGYKNPELWVKVAQKVLSDVRFAHWKFVWVGEGPQLDAMRRLVAEHDRIEFLGHREDAVFLLSRSTIYFHPSWVESFGLSVAEAMSFGIPCVVSQRAALTELIHEGVEGCLFNPDSPVEAQGALERLMTDPGLCDRLGRNARAAFLEKFDLKVWEGQMDALLAGRLPEETS